MIPSRQCYRPVALGSSTHNTAEKWGWTPVAVGDHAGSHNNTGVFAGGTALELVPNSGPLAVTPSGRANRKVDLVTVPTRQWR